MPPIRKPPRHFIARSIQGLIRFFPSRTVRVVRVIGWTMTPQKTRKDPIEQVIYHGEALFIPAGGQVQVLGLGLYEEQAPRLMVPQHRPIQPGDKLTVDGNIYEIMNTQDRWNTFVIAKLRQFQQGSG